MVWRDFFSRSASLDDAKQGALAALEKDAGKDITSSSCIGKGQECSARIISRSDAVLCGIVEADAIFRSRGVETKWAAAEGEKVRKWEAVCSLSGNCRAVLACERTALNYLMLLSGIATKCAAASEKFGMRRIAATRKTLPGLTSSEKRAVYVGGCLTHRMSLGDGILVKDNHIAAIMQEKKVNAEKAIGLAVASFPSSHIVEVEVSSLSQAIAAVNAGASAILVDNMAPAALGMIKRTVRMHRRSIIIEASGGITLENAGAHLAAGADFVSTSELTMKVEPADFSLEIK